MITIVDYGIGNLGSIRNMLKKIGFDSQISDRPEIIKDASKLIMPGVGAFDAGMRQLNASGLVPYLEEKVLQEKTPVLGICLGMQLLTRRSEEGTSPGLGWIDAEVKRFLPPPGSKLKVPHMGWNIAKPAKVTGMTANVESEERYYFVHSYYVHCQNREDVLLSGEYGQVFDAAFERGNIIGVQFHPEKSHKFGMRLLRNFCEGY